MCPLPQEPSPVFSSNLNFLLELGGRKLDIVFQLCLTNVSRKRCSHFLQFAGHNPPNVCGVCFIWGHSIGLYATWDPPQWPQKHLGTVAFQTVSSRSVTVHLSFLCQVLDFALLMELHEVSVGLIPNTSLNWKWHFPEQFLTRWL